MLIKYLDNPLFGVVLSIVIFSFAQYINKKTKLPFLNPLLVTLFLIISILIYFKIDYTIYERGGSIISFFLGPATVVLAVPLFKQIRLLQKHFIAIIIGIFVGSLTGILSIIWLSKIFKIDSLLMLSLIPKSTTTAIAMEISTSIGGINSMTIAFVVVTGITGYMISPLILNLFKINNKVARGIAIGTSSHAMGTAKAMEMGETEGAMSSLAISVAGIVTVVLAPLLISIIK